MPASLEKNSVIHISKQNCEIINKNYNLKANGISASGGKGQISAVLFILFEIFVFLDIFKIIEFGAFLTIFIIISAFGGIMRYASFFYSPQNIDEEYIAQEFLPKYTILSALYKEANCVKELIESFSKINWPKEKLDIIFLCEADDDETIQAILNKIDKSYMRIIILPEGFPKTKARALNIGLEYAKGDFLTIYDAEDRPHKDQLLEAFTKFQKENNHLAVLQAPLVAQNNRESFITAQFAIDYAIWFRMLLPFISKLTGFIPLGGTSNHFRTKILKEIGGWDSYNLTEDAELGLRIAKNKYVAKTIHKPTFEEAPPRLMQWLKQRTRWIHGHLQTIGMHFNRPFANIKQLGLLRFLGFLFGIILGPLFIIMRIPIIIIGFYAAISGTSEWFYLWISLTIGLELILTILAIIRDGRYEMLLHIGFLPIYWLLQAFAYARANFNLFVRTHIWEKTPHGNDARK